MVHRANNLRLIINLQNWVNYQDTTFTNNFNYHNKTFKSEN